MSFIELTSHSTGRTVYVRVDQIALINDYVNDERNCRYTEVWFDYTADHNDIHVVETPEEVLRRINNKEDYLNLQRRILFRFVNKFGLEEGVRRFQDGEDPPETDLKSQVQSAFVSETDWKQIVDKRRKRIDSANVSEAAKTFYCKHAIGILGEFQNFSIIGGWGDGYKLLQELDDAGLIMTKLVFLDHEKDTGDYRKII